LFLRSVSQRAPALKRIILKHAFTDLQRASRLRLPARFKGRSFTVRLCQGKCIGIPPFATKQKLPRNNGAKLQSQRAGHPHFIVRVTKTRPGHPASLPPFSPTRKSVLFLFFGLATNPNITAS
jgi:hypothetical protein